jgi:hypothetical protein
MGEAFDRAWDVVKSPIVPVVYRNKITGEEATQIPIMEMGDWEEVKTAQVSMNEKDECCETVRQEFLDYLIWASGKKDSPKDIKTIKWLVEGADCERLYTILENMASQHPRAREFLQMWDNCSSGKNEGYE